VEVLETIFFKTPIYFLERCSCHKTANPSLQIAAKFLRLLENPPFDEAPTSTIKEVFKNAQKK